MFILYEMYREVRIEPRNLGLDRVEAITDELNSKFANRVVLDVGLCMSLWDILEIQSGIIYPGDGGVHSMVRFRYIVFRPFQDEIIVGKIKRCTHEGVHVGLGFFDDILIPREGLQYPSKFDEREQLWIWEYKADGGEEVHEMYMDKGENIRFRVTGEQFCDTTPIPSTLSSQNSTGGGTSGGQQGQASTSTGSLPPNEEDGSGKTPYSISASINEPGLGLLTWWS